MRGVALVLLGVCAALLATPGPAHSAPVVTVKARTDIRLWPVARQSGGVVVRGEVVRRHSREPVAGEWVSVTMNADTQRVRTDGSGVFEARFFVHDGRYDIDIAYDGGPYTASSQSELRAVDIGKQTLRLGVSADGGGSRNDAIEVSVSAVSRGIGARVDVDLYAGPAGEPRYVARIGTDIDGQGSYSLQRSELGGPGRKRLVVKFEGDDAFNPTEAQTDIVVSLDTRTSLRLDTDAMAFEAELLAQGRVTDDAGDGVADGPVTLKIGARRLASTLSDEDGNFRFRVPGAEIGSGRFNVQAMFEPSTPWQGRSRSDVLSLRVDEPQPVPLAHTMAAFGSTAMVMVAFLGLRTRPWQRWLARLRRTGAARDNESGEERPADPAPATGGLRPTHTGIMSSLRRPNDFEFSGVVHDVITDRPIPGALVALVHSDGSRIEATCGGDGGFRFEALTAGTWKAETMASGYVSERFPIALPHRGNLRGARIDLLPVRERIFAMYREIAEPLLPDHDKWGVWTPRQIFDHVRAQYPAPALATLTDFVEETYFSQRTPQEDILGDAAQRIDAARAEAAAPLVLP